MVDIISQVINILLIVFGVSIIGIVTFIFVLENKFKHKITIKKVVNGNTQVIHEKFRTKRDSNGIAFWKFRKLKKEVTPFPNSCVGMDNKGKLYTQCYQLDDDTFVPIKDTFDPNNQETYDEMIKTLQPLTSSQRSMMVNQQKKADRNRKKSIADMITAAIPYISVVMILLIFMIFYGDVIEPMKEMNSENNAMWIEVSNNFEVASSQLNEIINNKQTLIGENNFNNSYNPPN